MADGAEKRDTEKTAPAGLLRRLRRSLDAKILRRTSRYLEEAVRGDRWTTRPFLRLLRSGPQTRFHRLFFARLEWLDETRGAVETTLLEPAAEGLTHGPKIGGVERVERVRLPEVRRHEFRDARVCAMSSSVLLADRVIIERAPDIDIGRCDYSTGHVWSHGNRTAVMRSRPVEILDAGFFLGGNGAFNYYHWMIEILPKVQYARDSDGPLLVSDDVARIPTFREALDAVAGMRPVVFLDKERTYLIKRLAYVDTRAVCPVNLTPGEEFRVEDFAMHRSGVDFLRSRLCSPMPPAATTQKRRIFLARNTTRRNYNQEEVFDSFDRLGFRKVYLERLTLRQQIDEITAAEMIVGPTGAAWANLVFASPGTKCLCWRAEESRAYAGYSELAHAVGADMRYVTYRTGAKETGQLYLMDYRVDPAALAREMEALLR